MKNTKKLLALLLAAVLVLGMFPMNAFAEDGAATIATTAATGPAVTDPVTKCENCGAEGHTAESCEACTECKQTGTHGEGCSLNPLSSTNAPTETTTATEATPCQVCGNTGCTATHVFCEVCQKYDCGLTHVFCEVCQKYDCGMTHVFCEVCQKYDCGMTHVFCEVCQKNDCGLTHVFCEVCQKNDCGIDHSTEPTTAPTTEPTKEEETVAPEVGTKRWLKPGTKVYKSTEDTEGYKVIFPYHIEIKAVQTVGETVWYQYAYADISAIPADYLPVKDYQWVMADGTSAEEIKLEDIKPEDIKTVVRTVANEIDKIAVEISGMMPEDVELELAPAKLSEALKAQTSILDEHVAFALDITPVRPTESTSFWNLLKRGEPTMEEWQPEAEPVMVSVDVDAEDGQIIAIYHEDDEGNTELVGTYPVKDGKVTFEAKSFSIYTGVLVVYQTNVNNVQKQYLANGQKISILELFRDSFGIDWIGYNIPIVPSNYNYSIACYYNDNSLNTGEQALADIGLTWDENTSYLQLNTTKGIYANVQLYDGSNGTLKAAFTIRNNLYTGTAGAILPADNTAYFIYQNDNFYYCDVNGNVLDVIPLQSPVSTRGVTMEDAINCGYKEFGCKDVVIYMNDTYVSDTIVWPAGDHSIAENWGYEPTVQGPETTHSTLIQRYRSGDYVFNDVLIRVQARAPINVRDDITIDNNSNSGQIFTAIEVTNAIDGNFPAPGDRSALLILRGGKVIDSGAIRDGEYRGTGVKIRNRSNSSFTEMIETKGGALELDTNCEIRGFAVGVDQVYGVTRLKATYGANININDNGHSVDMHPLTYIGKWDDFNPIPKMSVFLYDIDKWKSGDIVLGSGYWWAGPDDLRWSAVTNNDNGRITFANSSNLSYSMGVAFYSPYGQWGGNGGLGADYRDPYPVLRFQKYSVYNVNKGTWYFTLTEAVADAGDGHELVFYDSTSEPGTININKNLTIRSSYQGELSKNGQNEMIADTRGGSNCTTLWNTTNGSGIIIATGKTVNFKGTSDSNTCGTLTLDANGKGRVIENNGTMNMEDRIILTGGSTTKNGGAVLNNGTLNLTGGTISSNSAADGDGIYQNGTFNLSGAPVFSGHSDQDVYLSASATTDVAAPAFRVITKAGELTYTNELRVTLGNADGNLYDGRNVVEGINGIIIERTDLGKFAITNSNVEETPTQISTDKFAFVYTASDATPNNTGEHVLELDIRANLKIEKVLSNEDSTEATYTDAFVFEVVTLPGTGSYSYKTFNTSDNAEVTDGSDTVAQGETLHIKGGQYVIIYNIEPGAYKVEETGVNTADFTTAWRGDQANGTEVSGTLVGGQTKHVTCTNTKLAKMGTLELKKEINKLYAADADPTGSYTFTIDFGGIGTSDKTATYTIGTRVTNGSLTDGGTITLNKDETAVIEMPIGDYTITETALNSTDFDNPNWSDKVTVDSSNAFKVSGTLVANAEQEVICTNNYKQHLFNLTITKAGVENCDSGAPFVFNVKGGTVDLDVVVYGNGSVTVKDIPIGTYTVKETTGYWRYELSDEDTNPKTVVISNDNEEVKFKNERTEDKWLDDFAKATNKFKSTGIVAEKS